MSIYSNRSRLRVLMLAAAKIAGRSIRPHITIRRMIQPGAQAPAWCATIRTGKIREVLFSSSDLEKIVDEVLFVVLFARVAHSTYMGVARSEALRKLMRQPAPWEEHALAREERHVRDALAKAYVPRNRMGH